MASSCLFGFDTAALPAQVLATCDRVARDPKASFTFADGYPPKHLRPERLLQKSVTGSNGSKSAVTA